MTDLHAYATLKDESLLSLDIGDQVFISYEHSNHKVVRAPAFVWNKNNNSPTAASVSFIIPHGNNTGNMLSMRKTESGKTLCRIAPFGNNADKFNPTAINLDETNIHIEQRISILVNTPHGTMRVSDKCDDEYPGFWIELPEINGCPTLTMCEYVPGGEGTCSYMMNNLTEMRREDGEVPDERREPNNCMPDNPQWYNKDQISAGFITRAFPDAIHDEEYHYRTLHFGYPTPNKENPHD